MPVQRILALDWEQTVANAIGSRDIQVDTTFGPVRDLVAFPVSVVADRINADIVQLSNILSLQNVSQFSTADMDAIAYNSQIFRGQGTPSVGIVSLLSSSPPTTDVTININFPFATDPDPATGAVFFFAATQQAKFVAANANNYYDAINRVYRLDIPVQSIAVSADANVGPNTIINAQRAIGGFTRITNFVKCSGGTDAESNQDLANTLLVFNLGVNDISTPYGIGLETTRQFPTVTDYVVVFGSDKLLTRASVDAGATDVYIIGSQAQAQTESFAYDGQAYVFKNQPLLSIASATSGAKNFVQGVDYVLAQDLAGPYGGSVRGRDALQFLPTSQILPAIGDTVIVTYNYNTLIGTIQNFFNAPKFRATGRDLLYKQGQQFNCAVSGTLTVLPGFNPATVRTNVVSAISNYINSLQLGQALEQFNLITSIGQTVGSQGGIDNFVPTLLDVVGGTKVLPQLVPTEAQFIRIDQSAINVSFG